MARYILDIRDELDIPIILVEHDMGLVMDLADRVMVVDFGVPIATGAPAEIQNNPDVIRAYLGRCSAHEHCHATPGPAGRSSETPPGPRPSPPGYGTGRARWATGSPCGRRTSASGRRSPGRPTGTPC